MIKCISRKKVYPTREIAEDALIEARASFEYGPHRGPVAVYQCDECGQYHLTSKGEMNQKLSEQITTGKLDRQKEANRWLDKLKKK